MKNQSIVALEPCRSYDAGELHTCIAKLLKNLGGIGSFVKHGQSVLIKPNLLTDRTPEQAVTTHPEVVRAVIRLLKKHGTEPIVADSPSNVVKIEKVWEKTGFKAMCAEENVPLVSLEKSGVVSYEVDGFSFNIAKPILEADVVINMPKIKTHMLTILTGAVKNMFGAVPGFQKMNLHKAHHTAEEFGKLIATIYRHVPPQLNIADAVIGMHGDGPSGGMPIHLGFLAASRDATALDQTLCRILNIDPAIVPYLPYLGITGTPGEPAGTEKSIEIVGAAIENLAPGNFTQPATSGIHLIPRWLIKMVAPFVWIVPAMSDKCISCGRCAKGCPATALTISHKGKKPVLDQKKCIGCCCCHEVCPARAITMTQSPLLQLVRRSKMP